MNFKKIVGEKAAEYVENGMVIGLGTGSTAYWAIKKIGSLVRDGLKITAVSTSNNTQKLALEEKIPMISLDEVKKLDITIDGADEFDHCKNLIKGGGGALLREKIVASLTDFYIIIADSSKRVDSLGRFPLPVEVVPFAWQVTFRNLEKLGCMAQRRNTDGKPFVTDNQNYIIDCFFNKIENAEELQVKINLIPGVVENGLFLNMTDVVITNDENGNFLILK